MGREALVRRLGRASLLGLVSTMSLLPTTGDDDGLVFDEATAMATSLGDKRGRDLDGGIDGGSKRLKSLEGTHVLKLLVPNAQTGGLIGKQGAVLRQIMDGSGTKVRISATDEVVPKTGERVATITGPLPALCRAQQLISQQLMLAQATQSGADESLALDAERSVKMLIPNHSCGLVIGKAGALIKELMERTGATVRVSQPSDIIAATQERVITFTGTPHAVDAAQMWVSETLAQAPLSQQPKQLDYAVLKQAALPPAYPHGGYPHGAPQPPYSYPPTAGPPSYSYATGPVAPSFLPPPTAPPSAPAGPPRGPPMEFASFVATLPPSVEPAEQLQRYQAYLRTYAAGGVGGAPAPSQPQPAVGASSSQVMHRS